MRSEAGLIEVVEAEPLELSSGPAALRAPASGRDASDAAAARPALGGATASARSPRLRYRGGRRAWLRWIVGTAWTLVAAELFLRLFAPVPMLPRYVTATPYGVRGNMPNQTYDHTTPDVRVRMQTNAHGLRADHEIPHAKPAGQRRIVVLGDSFGMGYEVALEDTFLAVLERQLEAAGHDVEIVNLSVSGHGTAEELLALRHAGWQYAPDLVLLAWHDTDPEDNLRCGLFALEEGRLERRAETFLPGVRTHDFLVRFAAYRWLAENSHLYNWLRETAARRVKELLVAVAGSGPTAAAGAAAAEDAPPAALSAAAEPATELSLALLREIRAECAARGVPLVVLEIPTRPSRTEFLPSFPRDAAGGTHGFRVVSPLPRFEAHRGELLFWERGHYHLTPLGCRLTGEALAEAILADRVLDRPTEPTPP